MEILYERLLGLVKTRRVYTCLHAKLRTRLAENIHEDGDENEKTVGDLSYSEAEKPQQEVHLK